MESRRGNSDLARERHPMSSPVPQRRPALSYLLCWGGCVFAIVDISDMSKPKTVSTLDWSPPYPCPTHTTLPMLDKIMGRDFMIVTDEEVGEKLDDTHNAFL